MFNSALIAGMTKKAKFTVHNVTKIYPKKNSWYISLGMVKTIPKKFCQIKKEGFSTLFLIMLLLLLQAHG